MCGMKQNLVSQVSFGIYSGIKMILKFVLKYSKRKSNFGHFKSFTEKYFSVNDFLKKTSNSLV